MIMEKFYALINREYPTLIEFYSSKSSHEEKMSSVIDKFKEEKDFVTVQRYDIDDTENSKLVEKYEIKETPTFIMFHEGEPVWRDTGEVSLNTLKEKANKFRLRNGGTHSGSHQAQHSGRRDTEPRRRNHE